MSEAAETPTGEAEAAGQRMLGARWLARRALLGSYPGSEPPEAAIEPLALAMYRAIWPDLLTSEIAD